MKPSFMRSAAIKFRLVVILVLSLVVMAVDKYADSNGTVRALLNSVATPFYYLASIPQDSVDWMIERMRSKSALRRENEQLKQALLLQNEQLQRFSFLQQENDNLRALLDSPVRQQGKKMIAQIMSIDSHPFRDTVVVNKGFSYGVYQGQPVIDEFGVIGQVTSVATTSSRVILISDRTHAIPVRIERNGVSAVLEGHGQLNTLQLNNIPHSIDIQQGDVLVTSGLGGVFPEGYPVATITRVEHNLSLPFTQISAEPIAQLDRLNQVLLLWHPNKLKQAEQLQQPEPSNPAAAS